MHANYPLIARQATDQTNYGFELNGIKFAQNTFNIVAGLNTVDNERNVERTFRTLQQLGLVCARMGAFKPRTSPYSFQGLGDRCLPYVFALAATYGIKLIAIEITHEAQLDTICDILATQHNPTKILVQIGTRNAQNFELLKALGKQQQFPILYKRGYGITLEESIAACEYLAHAGNDNIIFCLRGMKSHYAGPHRNFVDVAHVPVIKRLTKMPVCVDPSHAVGNLERDLNDIPDIFNVAAQAVVAGANMLLVDVHPEPATALVDAQQAIALDYLGWFVDDMQHCRELYLQRSQLEAILA
ncbi:MAG TPA: 3-deoxy-7-phosphoheptulonate synthase [Gammaproteobacteria bacterium]|nr:3-deoxy-7-phosphoheptulonate synthase [Gammaproteobacteria bacterium]